MCDVQWERTATLRQLGQGSPRGEGSVRSATCFLAVAQIGDRHGGSFSTYRQGCAALLMIAHGRKVFD